MRNIILLVLGLFILSIFIVTPVQANSSNEEMILSKDDVIDEDYFSISKRVEVNGVVNGDAYLMGGEVVINGVVNGDLLVAGANVVITGEVTGDVRAGGANVTFSGAQIGGNVTVGGANVKLDSGTEVNGSIVAGSANLQIFSPIGKGANIGGSNVSISNSVGGNLSVGATNISLSNDAVVDGNFTYYSEKEANVSEDAVITGETKREAPKQVHSGRIADDANIKLEKSDSNNNAGIAIAGLVYTIKIIDVFWLIILGLILIYLFPKFSNRTAEYSLKKIGWSILAGLALLFILPIIGVLLFVTIIGIPISFAAFFAFFLIFWLGRIFVIYGIGLWTLKRFSKKEHKGVAYILGMVIYIILNIIPVIDIIVSFVVAVAGVGALIITKGKLFKELREKRML